MTIEFANYTSSMVQVYMQGAPEIQAVFNDGTVTFDNVTDFGSGVIQPTIGIYGGYRILASPPLADVQPNAMVAGENLIITDYSGIDAFGTGKVSWKADSSALAYGMRAYSRISQIPAISPDGQYVVFERVEEFDTTSSLWIINRDGSGLHKLAEDAGRPAWGQVPPPPTFVYLPMMVLSW